MRDAADPNVLVHIIVLWDFESELITDVTFPMSKMGRKAFAGFDNRIERSVVNRELVSERTFLWIFGKKSDLRVKIGDLLQECHSFGRKVLIFGNEQTVLEKDYTDRKRRV
jgi:hypothetical protein